MLIYNIILIAFTKVGRNFRRRNAALFILIEFWNRNEFAIVKSTKIIKKLNYRRSVWVEKSEKALILQKICCTHLKMGKRNNY